MGMFATGITGTVEIVEGGETYHINIRALSGRSLQKAADAKQGALAATARAYGGDVVAAVNTAAADLREKRKQAAEADPKAKRQALYDSYDRDSILQSGVTGWDHEKKFSTDAVADFTEPTAQKCHEAIIDLSIPPEEVAEEQESKG